VYLCQNEQLRRLTPKQTPIPWGQRRTLCRKPKLRALGALLTTHEPKTQTARTAKLGQIYASRRKRATSCCWNVWPDKINVEKVPWNIHKLLPMARGQTYNLCRRPKTRRGVQNWVHTTTPEAKTNHGRIRPLVRQHRLFSIFFGLQDYIV